MSVTSMSMPFLDTVQIREARNLTQTLLQRVQDGSQSLNYETNDEEQIRQFKLSSSKVKKGGSENKLPPIRQKSLQNLNSIRDSQKAMKQDMDEDKGAAVDRGRHQIFNSAQPPASSLQQTPPMNPP